MARLVYLGITGRDVTRRYLPIERHHPLRDDAVIGRSKDCNIQILTGQISRTHASISNVAGVWYVRDAGSLNGTLVNSVRIMGACALCDRDVLELGDAVFEFVLYDFPFPSDDSGETPPSAYAGLRAIQT